MRAPERKSRRNEQINALDTLRPRLHCDARFRGVFLGTRAECFPAISPASAPGFESCRAQLRGENDSLWQLRSRCSSAIGQRTGSLDSLFHNSGVDPVLGSIAVSWRMHFRARASCALLKALILSASGG
jgi:hypothetical protein